MNCCRGATCSCKIEAGDNITVDGSGQSNDPFIVSAEAPPPDVIGGQYADLTAAYVADTPVTMLVKQVATTTDGSGNFDVLTATDLTGYAGVLAVTFQETGSSIAWRASITDGGTKITAVARKLLDGTTFNSQAITGIAVAWVY